MGSIIAYSCAGACAAAAAGVGVPFCVACIAGFATVGGASVTAVRDGRVQLDVERFRIVDDGLRTSAVDKVMDVLKQHPTPTRFEDFDPLRSLVATR